MDGLQIYPTYSGLQANRDGYISKLPVCVANLGNLTIVTLAGGCFWCTEAIFGRLKGVVKTTPGYAEGAEVVQIRFDPKIISFEKLLEVFFALHDPTTLNKQGADEGTQYRSAIFYHDEEQKRLAEEAKAKIAGAVTEITPLTNFSPAENYHKDYYERNRNAGYCRIVIDPKITKLYGEFGEITASRGT